MESLLQDTSTSLYNYEIIFLISFLELYISDNNDRHLKCMKLIGDKYKTNLLLTFVAARLSYKLGLNDYTIEILPRTPRDINSVYGDYSKLKSICDWEPQSSLRSGIKEMIYSYKNSQNLKS